MPLSVVDLYTKVLPRTNCRDCGHPTCLAFASMVVSEQLPLAVCPHLAAETVARHQPILDAQHAQGKWTKKDLAADALQWARERSAGMRLEDLPARIGGRLVRTADGQPALELPYFTDAVVIRPQGIQKKDGTVLNRWEQVFIYNHLAQGGSTLPAEDWRGLEQIPNTVSKIKSMQRHVEAPLVARFRGRIEMLARRPVRWGPKMSPAGWGPPTPPFNSSPCPASRCCCYSGRKRRPTVSPPGSSCCSMPPSPSIWISNRFCSSASGCGSCSAARAKTVESEFFA